MLKTIKKLVGHMRRANFDQLTQSQRLELLAYYYELAGPINKLQKTMFSAAIHKDPVEAKPLVKDMQCD
jgi:hypothetical protein